jgi:hypothetical protein
VTLDLRRTLVWSLPVPPIGLSSLGSTGCASIIRGKHQEIRLDLRPADAVATYKGRKVQAGDRVTIIKGPETPSIHFDAEPHALKHNLEFDLDPWLIGDAALLLAGILPGVIDIGNGAWRNLRQQQTIYLPVAPGATAPAQQTACPKLSCPSCPELTCPECPRLICPAVDCARDCPLE